MLALFALHALFLREHGPARDRFLRSLPWYLTYTSNWLVDHDVEHAVVFSFAWSLAAEEQFYLGFPWVLRVSRGIVPAALFMGAVLLVDQAAERDWIRGGPLLTRMLRGLATPKALGSLAALLLQTRLFAAADRVLGQRLSPVFLLGLVVCGAALPWSLLTVLVSMALLVVSCCLREDHLLAPVLGWRPLRHVGVVSYGMYLLNVPALQLAKRLVPAPLVFVLGLALTVALATLAHAVVEKPFEGMRARHRR